MNDHIAVLKTIHARLSDLTHDAKDNIADPMWMRALMSMTPHSESVRHANRWLESRSERLGGGRTLYAVIARDDKGAVSVTAYIDASTMAADIHRLSHDILGRERGVRIRNMNALELLHRTVVNEHGAVFHVGGLYLDARSGRIVIDLLDLDADDNPIPGTECGVYSLDGWEVF